MFFYQGLSGLEVLPGHRRTEIQGAAEDHITGKYYLPLPAGKQQQNPKATEHREGGIKKPTPTVTAMYLGADTQAHPYAGTQDKLH